MVSFYCDACGETVKKSQVEKHYQTKCPACNVLCCLDCGKNFHGDDYKEHTSCISEAEKYQGKLFKPKDKQNKGERKQQEWLKQVRDSTQPSSTNPKINRLMKKIRAYSNIPRKKAKFQNFCKNSINVWDHETLDRLWEAFSGKTKDTGENTKEETNGVVESSFANDTSKDNENHTEKEEASVAKKEKKKKRKRDESENESLEEHPSSKNMKATDYKDEELKEDICEESNNLQSKRKFKWKSVIRAVLKDAPGNELPVKKLRKKVVAEYKARGGESKSLTDNELRALFDKKLNTNPKFKVRKERAKLVTATT